MFILTFLGFYIYTSTFLISQEHNNLIVGRYLLLLCMTYYFTYYKETKVI